MVGERKSVAQIQTNYAEQKERSQVNRARKRVLVLRRLVVFLFVATAISYFMISSMIRQSTTLSDMRHEKKQLDVELASLKKQEEILNEEIVKLNDEEYVAKLARKDYFLSNSNEIIFNLPDEKKNKEKTSE